MRKPYVVVRGVYSPCGMHPGPRWKPCQSCERARAATEAALADVIPRADKGMHDTARRGVGPIQPAKVEQVRELHAAGRSQAAIARDFGLTDSAVHGIVSGRTYNRNTRAKVAVIGGGQSGFGGKARRKHYAEHQPFVGHASR